MSYHDLGGQSQPCLPLMSLASTPGGASPDWLRRLLDVARVAATAAAFVPFPYIKAAASATVELLEQIDVRSVHNQSKLRTHVIQQNVRKNKDDMRILAESIVFMMTTVHDHVNTEGGRRVAASYKAICEDFHKYVHIGLT